jgi:hypothetical protein
VPHSDCSPIASYHPKGVPQLTSTRHRVIIARMGKVLSGFGLPPNAREGQKRFPIAQMERPA